MIKPTFLNENFRDTSTTGSGAFGCSFTYGTGVVLNNTWPYLLGTSNYGLPGSSNDRICRLAIEYINLTNPNKIYVMWTFKNRREWIDEDNNILRFKSDDVNFKWEEAHLELHNEHWDNYNYNKNKLLLENFCVNNNVELYQLNVSDIKYNDLGDDGLHPGKEWHINVSEHFTKQMVGSPS